jgi:hypothetical protein
VAYRRIIAVAVKMGRNVTHRLFHHPSPSGGLKHGSSCACGVVNCTNLIWSLNLVLSLGFDGLEG